MGSQSLFIFLFLVAGSLFNYSLISRWWIWPRLSAQPLASAVQPLLQFAAIRYLGAATLAPVQVAGDLDPAWAVASAAGDLVSATIALLALFAVRGRWSAATALVWTYVVVGSATLAVALVWALFAEVPERAGSFIYLVGVLIIPAGVLVLVMLYALMRSGKTMGA